MLDPDENGLKRKPFEFVHQLDALIILFLGRSERSRFYAKFVDSYDIVDEWSHEPAQYAITKIMPEFLIDKPSRRPPTWKWSDVAELNPGRTFDYVLDNAHYTGFEPDIDHEKRLAQQRVNRGDDY